MATSEGDINATTGSSRFPDSPVAADRHTSGLAPTASRQRSTGNKRTGQPEGGPRFDRIAALLSALVVGGVFLDGWAHNHGKVDQSFFTPWHALLYSAFA